MTTSSCENTYLRDARGLRIGILFQSVQASATRDSIAAALPFRRPLLMVEKEVKPRFAKGKCNNQPEGAPNSLGHAKLFTHKAPIQGLFRCAFLHCMQYFGYDTVPGVQWPSRAPFFHHTKR
mmetsp:Transcript_7856/g.27977  ORF Transcript_7856/g.27977 Transcript_7856/m.27977 type:complete len:122 (+) Transcript_7856:255-620(+)